MGEKRSLRRDADSGPKSWDLESQLHFQEPKGPLRANWYSTVSHTYLKTMFTAFGSKCTACFLYRTLGREKAKKKIKIKLYLSEMTPSTHFSPSLLSTVDVYCFGKRKVPRLTSKSMWRPRKEMCPQLCVGAGAILSFILTRLPQLD